MNCCCTCAPTGVFGYYRLPQYDLLFFVGESTRHLLAPHAQYRQRMLAYAAGVSALLVAFVLYLGGSLIQRARTQERLLQQSAKFQTLLGNASDGIHMLDGDGLLVEANEAFLVMLGYDASAVGKLHVTDWSLTDPETIKARLADMIPRRAKSVFEGRYRRCDGTLRDAEISACGIEIDGKGYLYAAARDITERKQAEQALNESRDRFRKVVEQSPLSMALVSADGTIDYINRKAIETFGYLPEDIPHMERWWVQAYPDSAYRAEVVAQWSGLVQEALANGHEIGASEYRVTCKDGSVKTMSIFGVWVGEQVLVIFEDVTQRRQAEEQVRHLAYFDALTQLPNRRLLLDRLGQALIASNRSAEYGALMILDLDNFKALNDTRGHDVGDSLLVEVARRIVASVRQEDTVSRLGGDEYVVMVEGMGADETAAARRAEMIAEKIRTALNRPYALGAAQPHHSTPSIGVTLFRGIEPPIETLLKQADMALYQAKGAGRNTTRFFNPAMQAAIESRSRMEAALRHGLQHGEFRLYYQPQFDHNGSLTGAEALLRWLPPGQAPVSPAEFIPLAEETGLIVPLGLWVMQTACAQLRAWSADARARGLAISINVSARQFRQNDFVEQVFDALKQSGAAPALLKLELTESVVLENVEEVIDRMRQVKALGVTFALDDFGTGFSSLSYLKQLPLDQVKIDQSFVRDITRDPNDAAIVRAIIAMAASLGLNVIAEGVETPEQLQFLKDNGCLHYQGYLFAKPLPIEQWDSLLER
jgi:diguanylate cyclase (GGDEF)-like protein/PAS domain S-box-containing protein